MEFNSLFKGLKEICNETKHLLTNEVQYSHMPKWYTFSTHQFYRRNWYSSKFRIFFANS